MRLILIRHAQTTANVAYTMNTVIPGPELTALGQRQAEALPAALADEKLDAIYASTHRRTELTAAPLAAERGLAVNVRGGIREVSAGHWEGASDRASHTAFLNLVFGWPSDPTTRVPGGESGQEVLQRFDDVVDEAVRSGADTVAMVSHGISIRIWLACRAANLTARDMAERELDNTGMAIAELDDGPWRVISWAGLPIGPAGDEPHDSGPAGRPL
ncbi:histidine phosphatase family protein (plasmid) [Streptomyces sp. SDT5-1]|uniref:histidine phosphatase family protein n=1 Tax=Streptomyces sp. SDT5-1 TaxID=3406418 RepID=UPI003FD3D410